MNWRTLAVAAVAALGAWAAIAADLVLPLRPPSMSPARAGVQLSPGLRQHKALPGQTVYVWPVPDGKRVILVVSSNSSTFAGRLHWTDCAVIQWDLEDGRTFKGFRLDREMIGAAALSPDGKRLATGSQEGFVRITEIETGRELMKAELRAPVQHVAFAPGGGAVLAGEQDSVRILGEDGREQMRLVGHRGAAECSAFSPDGKRLLTGGADAAVRLWDLRTGKALKVFRGHKQPVLAVAFRPDGQAILSASADRTLRRWDVQSGEDRGSVGFGGGAASLCLLSISPDAQCLLNLEEDRILRLADTATGRELGRVPNQHNTLSAAFSADGRQIAVGTGGGVFYLWDRPAPAAATQPATRPAAEP